MIVTLNPKTGEKVGKEQIRSIVINEGKWRGCSIEYGMGKFFYFEIEKGDEYFTIRVIGPLNFEVRGFGKFDQAFQGLEHLETLAWKLV